MCIRDRVPVAPSASKNDFSSSSASNPVADTPSDMASSLILAIMKVTACRIRAGGTTAFAMSKRRDRAQSVAGQGAVHEAGPKVVQTAL